MSARPARLLRAPAALASGFLLAAAYPSAAPASWAWLLAPLALAVAVLSVRGTRLRGAAGLGVLTGYGFFLPHLHWTGVYVGKLPWLALVSLEAAFFAVPAVTVAWGWRRGRLGLLGAAVIGWTLEETLRGRIPFGGFPWGKLAFSQSASPLLGWAWLGGTPLLAAAVAAGAGALALLAVTPWRRPGRLARSLALPLAVLAAAPVGGLACHGLASATANGDGEVGVAAVQGNVPEAGLDFNAERRAVLDNHAAATRALADRVAAGQARRPDLVFWPENSSDIDPLTNPDAAAVITEAADAIGVPVLVGAVLDGPGDHVSNAGIVWSPSGTAAAGPGVRYVKRHPAPFGEYIPARSFFRRFSDKVDLVRRDFAPGGDVGALPMTSGGRTYLVGDVICFEVAYDGLVADPVRDGARLLVVQTNNATFGFTDESVQQLAMSRVRAVETGRAVVHVSTVGVSALIRPDGSTVATSGLFEPAVLEAVLPLRTDLTPAVRLGTWSEVLLILAGAALTVRRRRPRSSGPDPDVATDSPALTPAAS